MVLQHDIKAFRKLRRKALVRAARDSYTGMTLFRVSEIPTSMAPEADPQCVDATAAWHKAMECAMEEFGYDKKESACLWMSSC